MRGWLFLVASSLLVSAPALAADRDPARAEALFREGRRALLVGDLAAACASFQESYQNDPAPGAMLNLGECEERRGSVASAWQLFRQLARELPKSDERRDLAAERAAALAPRVPHVKIVVESPASSIVTRDGMTLDPKNLGSPVPINPGVHTIVVRAPGHVARSFAFSVGEGETLEMHVAPGPAVGSPPIAVADPSTATSPGRGNASATAGWVLGGTGVGLIGVGAGFGITALLNEGKSRSLCEADRCTSDRGVRLHQAAQTQAALADVLVGTGVVATGVGVYLVLHAHSSVRVDATARGAFVSGTW